MPVDHQDITDAAQIHEPKGLAALTGGASDTGKVYVSDGAGSGDWRHIPHSACYYDNIGTGTTITTPTVYTLIGPATTGDAIPREFTHNSLGRLTYTGTTTIDATIGVALSFKHSAGSGQDCFFQVHKNGSPLAGAQQVQTADSANYQQVTILSHGSLATNDYIEVFCKTSSGNIIIHALAMTVRGAV